MEMSLLCLESGTEDFVRVCCAGCADFGEQGRGEDAEDVGPVLVVSGGRLAHCEAGEALLEIFVERELDGDVGEAEESGCEARVEGGESFSAIHLACGVEGVLVVPGRSMAVGGGAGDLGLEASLDHPDGIRHNSTGRAGEQGGVYAWQPLIVVPHAVVVGNEPFSAAVVHCHVDCPGREIS